MAQLSRSVFRGQSIPISGSDAHHCHQQGLPGYRYLNRCRSIELGEMMAKWTRRRVLKGMLGGSAVTVALPLLDCFLDGNGEALASGAPLPTRFGTWFWGCGINSARWIPDRIGTDYDLKPELVSIGPFKNKVTVLSGFNCVLGTRPNLAHWSGIMATFTGAAPATGGMG